MFLIQCHIYSKISAIIFRFSLIFEFVFVCLCVYILGDFNVGDSPHPAHIYGHANMQEWNLRQPLESVSHGSHLMR